MEKKIMTFVQPKKAVRIVAYYSDFDGEVGDWKEAIYELFRYNMTWNFAYQIDMQESRKYGVYVCMFVKMAFENEVLGLMERIGFRKVNRYDEEIGVIDCRDLPEEMFIDYVLVD